MIGTLADIANMKPSVTDFTVDGHCSGCGACCSDFLPVSGEEVERIRAYVSKHHLKEHINKVAVGYFVDATCPFRDDVNRKCDVYDVRPEICRSFQCDQDTESIRLNRDLLHNRYRARSMRAEFFGNERNGIVANILGARLEMK